MTKNLIWRLKEQPTTEALRELVKDKIITNEEARQILFSQGEKDERDVESYKEEIRFLRELVDKLSHNKVNEIIKYIGVEVPVYKKYPWFSPYYDVYMSTTSGTGPTNYTQSNFKQITF